MKVVKKISYPRVILF